MQFIVYCRVYFRESWRTKSLVIVIWLLDLCHSALVASALWDSIIASDSGLDTLDTIPWSIGPAIELTAMITFIVQSFFAYRIYILQNKKLTVVIPIVVLSLARLVMTSITMSEMLRLQSYSAFFQRFSWIFTLGLSLSTLVDIMITTFMCYFFRRNRPTFTDTIRIIDALTFWTIQNGSMTSTATIATLICWKVMPQNLIFLGLHFIVAKLHANSLLATTSVSMPESKSGTESSTLLQTIDPCQSSFWRTLSTHLNLRPYNRNSRCSLMLASRQLKAGHQRGNLVQVNVEVETDSGADDNPV
ncbi:uncharacterized protein F5147DRAFT_713655 [Suillus discolor]|uniref:DUF6534 domain-containing protein n=1 Tax=Suillus discolor TaxID=1912936 RepID=A0A9P7F0S2_9AGAM|nr:uncharacterized protein F5147DRAFT_713655 [Suillus discolor]KAG2098749.1 hypothetical protein F5147DRAFT_713655 [Suillus discolor]